MTTIFVPIDVAALCIGEDDQRAVSVLQNSADFSKLPWTGGGQSHNRGPYLSEAVLSGSAPFTGETEYPVGVHLHWALPTALSRGEQTSPDAAIAFPTVPNRWLVVRFVVSGADVAAPEGVRAWVVESDRLNEAIPADATALSHPTVPIGPPTGDGQTFAYLGQTFEASDWAETQASRLSPLTATGYGDVSFAAYYPNSCTSFGLMDTLADLPDYDPSRQQISYVVCGWYSDPSSDPLAAGGAAAADALGWATGGATPTSTMLCGTLGGIVWRADNGIQTAGNPLAVTLGPTTTQALSAALAAAVAADDADLTDVEDVLNALQNGILPRSADVSDALPTLAETLHREGFSRSSGGGLWTAAPLAVSPSAAAPVPSTASATALGALNAAQTALDAARRGLGHQQRQLFSLWNAFQASAHQPAGDPYPDPLSAAQLQAMMTPLAASIQTAQADLTGQAAALDASATAVSALLAADGLCLNLTEGADRFWQPLDPAMVLVGQDVQPVARYTGNPAPACRNQGQLVSAASFQPAIVAGSTEASVALADLTWLPMVPSGAQAPVDALQAALADAVLTMPSLTGPVVAAAAASATAAGDGTSPAVMDGGASQAAYAASLGDFLGGSPSGTVQFGTATPPDPIAVQSWSGAPWLPIMLQYQITLSPFEVPTAQTGQTLPAYPATVLSEGGYALDPCQTDLVYGGSAGTSFTEYQGQTLIGPGASNGLVTAIANYIADSGNDDPDLPSIQQSIVDLAQLSQGMEGLTDSLAQLSRVLQLPVADPTTTDVAFVQSVAAAIGRENRWGPRFELSFGPLRAGILQLGKLRLVDAFGRFLDYQGDDLEVQTAGPYAPPAGLGGGAYLAPRLSQPARVRFDWIDAGGSIVDVAAPAGSPIFAYVVANRLNDALDVYSPDGTAALTISLVDDGASALVTPPPGSRLGTAATFQQITDGLDAELVAFARALSAQDASGDGAYLAAFLAATNAALETVLPARFAEDVSLAVLMGQPLALARARLAVETKGPAAPNQSWDALVAQQKGETAGLDAGIGQIEVPVRLGAVEQLNDTLLGYFAGGDYAAFNAVAQTSGGSGVTTAAFATTTVRPNGDPLALTLLLDPRGEVNATTGLLPVKTIQLPPPLFSAALSGLSVAFRIGSMLSGANAGPPVIPIPAQSQATWTWMEDGASGWTSEPPVEAALQANSLAYSPQELLEGWLVLGPTGSNTNQEG